jgi:hypothetical protein
MAQARDIHAAEQETKPEMRPTLRSRVWRLTGLADKTAWDLLQLLIVPLMLAAVGLWFSAQQEARQQELEDQRARVEREIEAERAEQVTFQAYLDQMGTLLLDRGLRAAGENSDVRRLARARTLVVLDALSPPRQERALRFLNEAELIEGSPPDEQPVITLKYASLPNSDLPHRILLRGANLQQADLSGSNLAYIDLRGTYLAGAHLEDADLEGANLEGADLSGAYLGGANLKGANVDDEQLAMCKSLEGATMPDGSKHD